jgi:hypothetical protein
MGPSVSSKPFGDPIAERCKRDIWRITQILRSNTSSCPKRTTNSRRRHARSVTERQTIMFKFWNLSSPERPIDVAEMHHPLKRALLTVNEN